jgi:FtsH-binding integral membrane protein
VAVVNEEAQVRAIFAVGAAGLTIAVGAWLELLLRRPLVAIAIGVLAILAATGIVVYDIQSDEPTEQPTK